MGNYDCLFSPFAILETQIKNGLPWPPWGRWALGDEQGGFNQRGIDYYTARARGAAGLIITGVTFVDNQVEEHGMPNCPQSPPIIRCSCPDRPGDDGARPRL